MHDEELTLPQAVQNESNHDSYPRMIINLFSAPTKSFSSLAVKPRWVLPFILCALTALIYEATTNQYRMADLKENLRTDQSISAEEAQRRIENIDSQAMQGIQVKALGLGLAILTGVHTVKLFGVALVVWLALQLYPQKARFISILSLASFAFLIIILEALLKIPLVNFKETTHIYLSAAAFLPSEWIDSILFRFIDGLNISSVCMATLLMIGIPVVSGIPRKKAIVTVSYLWFIWLLLSSMFGNLVRIG